MGKYIVSSGQNLFDVSLHIYGSIEGIIDLMMNNPELSFAHPLKTGDELLFSDDYVIDTNVIAYNKMNNIIPANGERHVYYKSSLYPLVMEIRADNKEMNTSFLISGTGNMEIDWGDNSEIRQAVLQNNLVDIRHSFDNTVPDKRRIRIYGNFSMKEANLSNLSPVNIYAFQPVSCERLVLNSKRTAISFLSLFKDVLKLDLQYIQTDSLLPLIDCKDLVEVNLYGAKIKKEVVDEYLIALVKKHYGRRNCTITLTAEPTGEYKEPVRDENSRYKVTYGMEAVWLLCNEPAWNESGYWKFIINGNIYTTENGQDN